MKVLRLFIAVAVLFAVCGLEVTPAGADELTESGEWVGQIAVSPSGTPPAQFVDPGQENVTAVQFVVVAWEEDWELFSVRFSFEHDPAMIKLVERITLYDSGTGETLGESVSLPWEGVMLDINRHIPAHTIWRFEARVHIRENVIPGWNVRIGIARGDDVVASGPVCINGPQMGDPLTIRGEPHLTYLCLVQKGGEPPSPPH